MTTAAQYRQSLDRAMTERQWMAQVEQFAVHRGWAKYHTFDSRRSDAGFPDLVLTRAIPGDRRIVFAELKAMNGKLSAAQRSWLTVLELIAELCGGHLEVKCWKPSDWDDVRRTLL